MHEAENVFFFCLKHSANARARLIRRSHGFQMVFRYLTLTNEAFAVIAKKKKRAAAVISAAQRFSFKWFRGA